MKKILRILSGVLALGMAFILHIPTVSAADDDPVVKIGLAYGNNAKPAPKLLNVAGEEEGYAFGWFDEDREFQEVACTDVRDLVIVKDKPIYMSASEAYSDTQMTDLQKKILPFHVQTDESFADYEEAVFIADSFRMEGVSAFPVYYKDEYKVRVGEYSSQVDAREAAAEAAELLGYDFSSAGGSTTCYTVVDCSSGEILFEFDQGGQPFGVMPYSEHTWYSGYKYCGGFEYNRVNGNDLTVINVIGIHDYVKGVITREMSPSWPIEALKAQAVCAKSYAYCNMGKHSSLGFDICNTTDCQVYYGSSQQNENSDAAVEDTYGEFVLYKGKVVPTFYHASSGGWTEDAKNVWGTEQGYLKAVEDKHLEQELPYSFEVTNSQLKSILKAKGYSITGNIVDFYVSEFTEVGNVRAITFVQDNGKELTFTGERARSILNGSSYGYQVKSQRFTITPKGGTASSLTINKRTTSGLLSQLFAIGADGVARIKLALSDAKILAADGIRDLDTGSIGTGTAGTYIVSGTGSGHNIGLSQWGAKAMADKGYHYEEILHFYFTDIEIDHLQ